MFALYGQELRIFEFVDYGALLAECRRAAARTVLEFGPGVSTLALIEAGCERIVSCEHDEDYLAKACAQFKEHRQVSLHQYRNAVEVHVQGVSPEKRFDLAFVDSPVGMEARRAVRLPGQEECSRYNTCMYALARAPIVLLHDAKREAERHTLARLATDGYLIEMIDTPKGIARITRKVSAFGVQS